MPGTSRLYLQARGDPFLGVFGKALGGLARFAGKAIGSQLGLTTPAARSAVPSVPGGGPDMAAAPFPKNMVVRASNVGANLAMKYTGGAAPSAGMPSFRDVIGGASSTARQIGGYRRRRRMNPANIRALRKAISRVTSFERIAGRVLHLTKRGVTVKGFKRRARRRR